MLFRRLSYPWLARRSDQLSAPASSGLLYTERDRLTGDSGHVQESATAGDHLSHGDPLRMQIMYGYVSLTELLMVEAKMDEQFYFCAASFAKRKEKKNNKRRKKSQWFLLCIVQGVQQEDKVRKTTELLREGHTGEYVLVSRNNRYRITREKTKIVIEENQKQLGRGDRELSLVRSASIRQGSGEVEENKLFTMTITEQYS